MDDIANERRRFIRVEGKSLVQFQGKNFQIYSSLSNIGEGGLFVNTYYMLEEGESVDIKFDLPRLQKTIGVKGKVVRQRDDISSGQEKFVGLGIKFEEIRDDDRTAIKDFVISRTLAA